MSWRSASTCGSMPRSRSVALVTGPIETTRAPSGTPPAAVEEEAHGGAGGEGHVRGARERRALGSSSGSAHRVVEREHVAPRRRARAGRRAARRAPRPRAPPARACPPRHVGERLEQRLGHEALGHHVGADAVRAQLGGRARADGRHRARRRAGARRRRGASKNSRTPLGLVKQIRSKSSIRGSSTGRGSIRIAGASTTSAPSAAQPRGQLARLRAGARDRHHLPVQRPALEPGERRRAAPPPGRPA